MNKIADRLRAARALISKPGTWIINESHRVIDGKDAYCATGAILHTGGEFPSYLNAIQSLAKTLQKRFKLGGLPTPIYGGGGYRPLPWGTVISNMSPAACVTQFNNSTSQAEVLALFDETIADLEGSTVTKAPEPVLAVPVRELEPA